VRFIDLGIAATDPEVMPLIEKAEEARQALLDEQDAEKRKRLIRSRRRVWVDFRAHFERIYGAKCWYTESKNPGTDDDIDHYRPKGALAGVDDHDGYWWQAFDWRNFRLSCHRANRLGTNPDTGDVHGKGSWFPLLDEAGRSRKPEDDLDRERPTLLDPTDPGDAAVLTFDQDGSVALVPGFEGDDEAQRRFEDSRKYLHLDWPMFREERQGLFARIHSKVSEGDQAGVKAARGDHTARVWLKGVAVEPIALAGEPKPYSKAAQAYIMRFRDRGWVRTMVVPHIPNPIA